MVRRFEAIWPAASYGFAVHAIDFARYTTGIEYTWVYASQTRKYQPDFRDLDTCGTIQFGLANGGSAVISYDYFRPMTATTHGDDRTSYCWQRWGH